MFLVKVYGFIRHAGNRKVSLAVLFACLNELLAQGWLGCQLANCLGQGRAVIHRYHQAGLAVGDHFGQAPALVTITGVPTAIASAATRPNASKRLGSTKCLAGAKSWRRWARA